MILFGVCESLGSSCAFLFKYLFLLLCGNPAAPILNANVISMNPHNKVDSETCGCVVVSVCVSDTSAAALETPTCGKSSEIPPSK